MATSDRQALRSSILARIISRSFICGGLTLACAACSPRGIIYTNVTVPLVTNMNNTPVGEKLALSDTKLITEPFTAARISGEWDSRAIGDAAKRSDITDIHYADLRILSILGGVWEQQTVRVWGQANSQELEIAK